MAIFHTALHIFQSFLGLGPREDKSRGATDWLKVNWILPVCAVVLAHKVLQLHSSPWQLPHNPKTTSLLRLFAPRSNLTTGWFVFPSAPHLIITLTSRNKRPLTFLTP